MSPYNVYPTSDGYVVLNAPGDHHFRSILDVIGRPDLKEDPRFLTRSTRVVNFAAVDELIEGWTKTQTKNEIARRMLAPAVPCAPVRDLAEVMHDENMHARASLHRRRLVVRMRSVVQRRVDGPITRYGIRKPFAVKF